MIFRKKLNKVICLVIFISILLCGKLFSQNIRWYGEFTYELTWENLIKNDTLLSKWDTQIKNSNIDLILPEKLSMKIEMRVLYLNDSTTAFTAVLKNLNLKPGIIYRNINVDDLYQPSKIILFFKAKNSDYHSFTPCQSYLTNKLGYYYTDTCYYSFGINESLSFFALDSIYLFVDNDFLNKINHYKNLINIYYEFDDFYTKSIDFIDTLQLDKPRLLLFNKFDLDQIDKKINDIGALHLTENLNLNKNDPINFKYKYEDLQKKLFIKQNEINKKINLIDSLLILDAKFFFIENKKQESLENIKYALKYNPNSLIAWDAYIKFFLKNNDIDSALIKTTEFILRFPDLKYSYLPKYFKNTIDTLWNISIENIDYLFNKQEYNIAISILERLKQINDGLELKKDVQLDKYFTNNYYKLFENFITIYDKSIEKGFNNIALHLLLEAQNFAIKNHKYISVNNILSEKKKEFLETLTKSYDALLIKEQWEDALEQIIMLDTLYRNVLFAEDSVLLNNHKNENLNKLLNSISHVCSVYIVGRDDKKIKKAYQTLMKLNNIIEKKDLLHNDFLDCKLKYQKVLLADLEAKYTKKNISQSRRKKIVETSYIAPTLSDAIDLLYLSEFTKTKLPDTLHLLASLIVCDYLNGIAREDFMVLAPDSFIVLHNLARCSPIILNNYMKKIKIDTCQEIKNKFEKELSIVKYYYYLDSLDKAKNHLIIAKNIWLNTLCDIAPLDLANLEKLIELESNFLILFSKWQKMYHSAVDSIFYTYQLLKLQYNHLPDSLQNKFALSANRIIFFSSMHTDSLLKLAGLFVNGEYLYEGLECLNVLKHRSIPYKYTKKLQKNLGVAFAKHDIKKGLNSDYIRYVYTDAYYRPFIKSYNLYFDKHKKIQNKNIKSERQVERQERGKHR
ncbi:MAG: hypothetical protein WBH58_00080 [Bacteroidales bacterium]|jgi:hypothetical protein|nr:hypothetical protein [Bacteroidales bacterium]MDI9575884.1 hypothetical protein [Bacteroidota bacterium]MDY0401438.1 hypothetical protein [Bacteroidales bacterium]HHW59329.1 hypothetical protein [Bacteroidales bacterium]